MRIRTAHYKNIFSSLFSRSKSIFFFGLILAALIALPLVRKINQQRALDREIKALSAQAEKIEQKNTDLREIMQYLDSDAFAEKEARVNLDLKKPGEKVVVIKDNVAAPAAGLTTVFSVPGLEKEQIVPPVSNTTRWWDYFFSVRFSR